MAGKGEFKHKDNTGSIFKNDYKNEDKHPDMTGTVNVEGIEKNVAAWRNTTDSGKEYLSLRFSDPKDK